MSQLGSSPLPLAGHHDVQKDSTPFVHSEVTSVNQPYLNDGHAEPSRRSLLGFNPAPSHKTIAVEEFAPTDYLHNDGSSYLPRMSTDITPGGYPYGALQSPLPQSLCPPSSSPMSCSSGGSFNAWTDPTSVDMSRNDSLGNSSFYNKVNMMRLNSTASNAMSDISSEAIAPQPDYERTLPTGQSLGQPDPFNDPGHEISHAGGAINSAELPVNPIINGSLFNSDADIDSCMRREVSTRSFKQGSASSKTIVDEACVMQRQSSLGSRRIEPKPERASPMSRESSAGEAFEMVKVPSSDGSLRDAVKITKAASYERPRQVKVKCPFPGCKKQPGGYKGEHEMTRHYDRDHKDIRNVYICVPRSNDPDFLSRCKRCKTFQKYNADYNAGEHLRRIHFNPRQQKTRRGHIPLEERRGGKGGGDWPPMEDLRKYMVTFEVNQKDERVSEPCKVVESSDLLMPDLNDHPLRATKAMGGDIPNFDASNPPLDLLGDPVLYDVDQSGSSAMFPSFEDLFRFPPL